MTAPTQPPISIGELKMIEARMQRSLRIAWAAILLMCFGTPVLASTFNCRAFALAIDVLLIALIAFNFIRCFILDRRLNRKMQLKCSSTSAS